MSNKYEVANYQALHQNIVTTKARAELAFYEYCKALNDMKESKAFKAAGYETFAEYTKENFGLEKTQAYVYANLAVKYSKDFLQENGKIGTAKLDLISKLPEEEATEFLKRNNVENITVKQLKRTLAEYKDKKESKATDIYQVEEPVIEIITKEITVDSFGAFVQAKRYEKGYGLKELADKLGISRQGLRHIETGRRSIVKKTAAFYEKLIETLELSNQEISLMYELRDKDMIKLNRLSPEVSNYLSNNTTASKVLHAAAVNNVSEEVWNNILKSIDAIPGKVK